MHHSGRTAGLQRRDFPGLAAPTGLILPETIVLLPFTGLFFVAQASREVNPASGLTGMCIPFGLDVHLRLPRCTSGRHGMCISKKTCRIRPRHSRFQSAQNGCRNRLFTCPPPAGGFHAIVGVKMSGCISVYWDKKKAGKASRHIKLIKNC